MGRLHESRPVVLSPDAAVDETVPVHELVRPGLPAIMRESRFTRYIAPQPRIDFAGGERDED
jgi:hypothetical protein